MGDRVLQAWDSLSQSLFQDFSDNSVISREVNVHKPNGVEAEQSPASLGYPAWWLQAVGYSQGPPLPPVELMCPPTCPAVTESAIGLISSPISQISFGVIGLFALAIV